MRYGIQGLYFFRRPNHGARKQNTCWMRSVVDLFASAGFRSWLRWYEFLTTLTTGYQNLIISADDGSSIFEAASVQMTELGPLFVINLLHVA